MAGSKAERFTRAVIAALACLAGCGDGGRTDLALSVGASAQFQTEQGPPPAVGYRVAVVIEQVTRANATSCPKLPSNLHLLVDGTEVAAAFDPSTGCLLTSWTSELLPQVGTVAVEAREGDSVLGHAEFSGLAPGGAATLATPAGAVVRAGDPVVVVPPADLSTPYVDLAYIYALDDPSVTWPQHATADREADGVHLIVPGFSGRGAITFSGMPYVPLPAYSCPGFDVCTADADHTLGPVFLTESP